ncbi:uncharacterized protein BDZ99DRAFT_66262 [Mytilinidion resinicola]|uniref:Uncharacterized protein n=1 Tax=Mytilinidion resinicola TaxID=574789 RepID=A0A6A6YGE3_9PEZI|nr:uncharacterized protein BDZ99DRAFT_66262 [Mytilinidion resinicola]KAF2807810.1 hypothetical protein BDZ99DRAFT_66262 [Mytilinidion resinicola]
MDLASSHPTQHQREGFSCEAITDGRAGWEVCDWVLVSLATGAHICLRRTSCPVLGIALRSEVSEQPSCSVGPGLRKTLSSVRRNGMLWTVSAFPCFRAPRGGCDGVAVDVRNDWRTVEPKAHNDVARGTDASDAPKSRIADGQGRGAGLKELGGVQRAFQAVGENMQTGILANWERGGGYLAEARAAPHRRSRTCTKPQTRYSGRLEHESADSSYFVALCWKQSL